MAKFSIEYKRTVRVQKYETLTIGMINEFDTDDITMDAAGELVKNYVNAWIMHDLKILRDEIDAED